MSNDQTSELQRRLAEMTSSYEALQAQNTQLRQEFQAKHPAVRIASMPEAIIPRGIATPSLLAFIITAKYVDGMPLNRQERSFVHARRKFVDAKGSSRKAGAADQALSLIARIYRVERELKDIA